MSGTIDTRFDTVEEDVEDIDIRLTNLENAVESMHAPTSPLSAKSEVWDHIKALEVEVGQLKGKVPTHNATSGANSIDT
eukprot:8243265-Pyramimonas_sp.AAC.1